MTYLGFLLKLRKMIRTKKPFMIEGGDLNEIRFHSTDGMCRECVFTALCSFLGRGNYTINMPGTAAEQIGYTGDSIPVATIILSSDGMCFADTKTRLDVRRHLLYFLSLSETNPTQSRIRPHPIMENL